MRIVLQRVSSAEVRVEGECVGKIGRGLLVLVAFGRNDTPATANRLAMKLLELRLFPDERGRLQHSVTDIRGEVLIVSQFTLYADTRRGRRPSFDQAASAEAARPLYSEFVERVRALHGSVQTGVFQAMMEISLTNSGPVTLYMESDTESADQ